MQVKNARRVDFLYFFTGSLRKRVGSYAFFNDKQLKFKEIFSENYGIL
jgi:hypothetical protein